MVETHILKRILTAATIWGTYLIWAAFISETNQAVQSGSKRSAILVLSLQNVSER